MKKNILIAAFCAALFSACGGGSDISSINVTVENTAEVCRMNETVEVSWHVVASKLSGVTADNVIVTLDGAQIPSQVMFKGGDTSKPETLIFQATVPASDSKSYVVTTGVKEEYEMQAFSRFVPERKGDYAWENNVVAQRVYGVELSNELNTSGVDVWSKTVSDLVIDKWYGISHYHKDAGEGMDCYKVGSTLGGGASAPLIDGKIILSGNMLGWERTANGPIRTEFTLTYEPFGPNSEYKMVKRYSLDANTHFTKVVDNFIHTFDQMDAVVGYVVHSPNAPQVDKDDYIAIYEPASDDQYKSGYQIGIGVIVPGTNNRRAATIGDHKVKQISLRGSIPSIYYIGTSNSHLDSTPTAESWFEVVEAASAAISNPLSVTIE